MVFHNRYQSGFAKKAARPRRSDLGRRPKRKSSATTPKFFVLEPKAVPDGLLSKLTPLRSSLSDDKRTVSVCLVRDRFSFEACDDTIASLFEEAQENTCFAVIADAVALAYTYRQGHRESDRKQSVQKYVTALQYTNKALSCPSGATSDGTLAAVALFGLYEVRQNAP